MLFDWFPCGPLQVNCFVIADPITRTAAVVDPGGDVELILERATSLAPDAKIGQILLTHGHGDHIGALADLKAATGAAIKVHAADEPMLTDNMLNVSAMFGLPCKPCPADENFTDGETLVIGELKCKVLHTPGHTPGSVTFVFEDCAITGDCLFREGIGRHDLPGGDLQTLCRSLLRLMELDDSLTIFPGHGPESTIGHERRRNPYILQLS